MEASGTCSILLSYCQIPTLMFANADSMKGETLSLCLSSNTCIRKRVDRPYRFGGDLYLLVTVDFLFSGGMYFEGRRLPYPALCAFQSAMENTSMGAAALVQPTLITPKHIPRV